MNNIHPIAQAVQSQGRGKDTQLVHMTPNEVAGMQALAKAHGGSLTVNPETGLVEAGFLDSMLPTLLGVGLSVATGGAATPLMLGAGIGGLQFARTGDLGKGLMAGLGAYGGAGLATGFMGAGATAASGGASGVAGSLGPLPLDQIPAATMGDLAAERAAQQALAQNATTAAGRTAATEAATNAGTNLAAQQAQTAAGNTFGQNMSNFGGGLQNAFSDPTTFMQNYGGSGGDLAMFGGAAAAAPVMNALGPKDSGPAPVDNEQYQYDFSSGRTSQADLDAQRLANPGGELRYFNPAYSNERKVRVAQGGILGLAEGGTLGAINNAFTFGSKAVNSSGMPYGAVTPFFSGSALGSDTEAMDAGNEFKYTFDPVTQTYKKVAPVAAPVAAPPPPQISQEPNGGGGFDGPAAAPSAPDISASGDAGLGGPSGNSPSPDGGGMDGGATMAKGGIAGLAAGGMARGGFVVAGDAVSAVGNGSTDAGIRKLVALFGPSVKHIKGKGDGLSDSIPTNIDGKQPARVADGEAYIPPETVAKIGGGDPKKGAQKLYAMMDKIRSQAHGKTTQQRKVDPRKVV